MKEAGRGMMVGNTFQKISSFSKKSKKLRTKQNTKKKHIQTER
jgi:hypothetical protein